MEGRATVCCERTQGYRSSPETCSTVSSSRMRLCRYANLSRSQYVHMGSLGTRLKPDRHHRYSVPCSYERVLLYYGSRMWLVHQKMSWFVCGASSQSEARVVLQHWNILMVSVCTITLNPPSFSRSAVAQGLNQAWWHGNIRISVKTASKFENRLARRWGLIHGTERNGTELRSKTRNNAFFEFGRGFYGNKYISVLQSIAVAFEISVFPWIRTVRSYLRWN